MILFVRPDSQKSVQTRGTAGVVTRRRAALPMCQPPRYMEPANGHRGLNARKGSARQKTLIKTHKLRPPCGAVAARSVPRTSHQRDPTGTPVVGSYAVTQRRVGPNSTNANGMMVLAPRKKDTRIPAEAAVRQKLLE